jgi:hypothetical protein
VEHLEIAAVKEGNHNHVVDDSDWYIPQIDCICQWQFVNHYPRILSCRHINVASQIGHLVTRYMLSLVEVPSSTSSVNTDGGKLLYMHNVL